MWFCVYPRYSNTHVGKKDSGYTPLLDHTGVQVHVPSVTVANVAVLAPPF